MQKVFAAKCNHRHIAPGAAIITLAVFVVALIQKRSTLNFYLSYKDDDLDCYFRDEENLPFANDHDFLSRKQIFFHETSCKGGLDSRQACAIESAAKVNRDWDINVFFVGPPSPMFLNSFVYKVLSQTNNINFYRVIISKFKDDTPMRHLMPTDKKYNLRNIAEMLRFLTLYKYGGVYLDLDLISVRSLGAFPPNWVAKLSSGTLAAGALGLAKDDVGRTISGQIIQNFNKLYDPTLWNQLSKGVLTHSLRDVCATKSVGKMSNQTCPDLYFAPGELNPPHTYGHNIWNNRSRRIAAPRDSLLANLARQFCPVTYQMHGDKFGY
ncbi:alpha-1,4-N-acetylglucosaminyltransferase-like isoform X2 [Hyposmocoma kahamanoa]|uniref:alpha-1,4-N-acetylglucosaminyltransferase-like isoform X2 n=1 Tax=Hyposmocoma kahamanoa TaxID=1477025 RepID=UPI000E6D62C9|nr:alpha-1,4-N-acetylglucosaminyltransferase-like isoform X2 [Hyposmocoma kahamanoa]